MTEEPTFSLGDFTSAISALAEEKGIEKDAVHSTVEAAIAAAYKKEYGKRGQNIRAEMDQISGAMKFFLVKEVVDETVREFITEEEEEARAAAAAEAAESESEVVVEDGDTDEEGEIRNPRYNEERDILLEEAVKRDPEVQIGDTIEEELPTETDFGRVAAQTAKQVIIQRIREVERDAMYAEYKEKEGELVTGTVQRVEGRTVFVDLGKSVAALFPREQIRGEHYSIGQRLKVYIESVELDTRGPGIKISRVHPEMVRHLFEMEVPEIFAGTVELKSIAREAGSRSKIAVWTEDDDIDPVGSCVGQKGMRVNTVIDALGGEKIDIIEWSDDPEEFIAAALAPANVIRVDADEENKHAAVLVPDDQLSLAIGKYGQNVRLAVKLTGWDLDVESEESKARKAEEASQKEEVEKSTDEASAEESEEVEESAQEEVSEEAPAEADAETVEEDVKKD